MLHLMIWSPNQHEHRRLSSRASTIHSLLVEFHNTWHIAYFKDQLWSAMPWAFVSQQPTFQRDVSLLDISDSRHKNHLAVLRLHETSMKLRQLQSWKLKEEKHQTVKTRNLRERTKYAKMQNSLLRLSRKKDKVLFKTSLSIIHNASQKPAASKQSQKEREEHFKTRSVLSARALEVK